MTGSGKRERRLWLFPHESLLIHFVDPMKPRRASDNPGRLRMLQNHGSAGLALAVVASFDGALGSLLILVTAILRVATRHRFSYVGFLAGVAVAALGMIRIFQLTRMRPGDTPAKRGSGARRSHEP